MKQVQVHIHNTGCGVLVCIAVLCVGVCQRFQAQGPLVPPGSPAPLMKTLDQLEPRTPLTNTEFMLPLEITNSGSYYLITNLVFAGWGIIVKTNNVTLDLNGFRITTISPGYAPGIYIEPGVRNVTIKNGTIGELVPTNGGVIYRGFSRAIWAAETPVPARNVRIQNIHVPCAHDCGFRLEGSPAIISACTLNKGSSEGIMGRAGTVVVDCQVSGFANTAIDADVVARCSGRSTDMYGVWAKLARDSTGVSGGGQWTAGVVATNAYNCVGLSSNGFGLEARKIAIACHGESVSNVGLISRATALYCFGRSVTSTGLWARVAIDCAGEGNPPVYSPP